MNKAQYFYAVNYNKINWLVILKKFKLIYEKYSDSIFEKRLLLAFLIYSLLEDESIESTDKIKNIWNNLPNIKSFLDLPIDNDLTLPEKYPERIYQFIKETYKEYNKEELKDFYLNRIFSNMLPTYSYTDNFKNGMLHNGILGAYSNLVKEEYR